MLPKLLGNEFCDTWHPPEYRRPTLDDVKEGLEKIWMMKEDGAGFDGIKDDPSVDKFLANCRYCYGRMFLQKHKRQRRPGTPREPTG